MQRDAVHDVMEQEIMKADDLMPVEYAELAYETRYVDFNTWTSRCYTILNNSVLSTFPIILVVLSPTNSRNHSTLSMVSM